MRHLVILGFLSSFGLFSCEKFDDLHIDVKSNTSTNNSSSTSNDSYYPLQIGNYWVYDNYEKDTLGNEKNIMLQDSITITRDTLINGNKYFVLEGSYTMYNQPKWRVIDILRDSAGYVVNAKGRKIMSNTHFDKNFYVKKEDPILFSEKMTKYEGSVNVLAGNFYDVITNNIKIILNKEEQTTPSHYAKGVGKIIHTYKFFNEKNRISEKRLVKYHIEK